jgi:hypothetical protein
MNSHAIDYRILGNDLQIVEIDRILQHAPRAGGKSRDESSILGGIGRLVGGDRSF